MRGISSSSNRGLTHPGQGSLREEPGGFSESRWRTQSEGHARSRRGQSDLGVGGGGKHRPPEVGSQAARRRAAVRGLPGLGRAAIRDGGGQDPPPRPGGGSAGARGIGPRGHRAGETPAPGPSSNLRRGPGGKVSTSCPGVPGWAPPLHADPQIRPVGPRAGPSPRPPAMLRAPLHGRGRHGPPRCEAQERHHGSTSPAHRPQHRQNARGGPVHERTDRDGRLHGPRAMRRGRQGRSGARLGRLGAGRHALRVDHRDAPLPERRQGRLSTGALPPARGGAGPTPARRPPGGIWPYPLLSSRSGRRTGPRPRTWLGSSNPSPPPCPVRRSCRSCCRRLVRGRSGDETALTPL